ncbi:hypothetical protein MNBD_NITROSPINAE03-381, partial [hydrothermal vent metagenome]
MSRFRICYRNKVLKPIFSGIKMSNIYDYKAIEA